MLGSSEIAESGVKVSSRILRRYVLRGEQVEVATRQHWAKLAEPVITVLLGFFFVAWVSSGLMRAFGDFGLYLWWVWFGLIARLVWRVFEWRNEWFVATDKRLLLTYGLFTHKVAMMPLGKVTDLNYGRSIIGRMLGYGDFTLESAGQDQALRKINWLPAPDETYRRICDIIFGPERFDSEDSLAHHEDPSTPESEQTDFDHQAPQHPEPARQRYTSDKIAADGDGGSIEDWDERDEQRHTEDDQGHVAGEGPSVSDDPDDMGADNEPHQVDDEVMKKSDEPDTRQADNDRRDVVSEPAESAEPTGGTEPTEETEDAEPSGAEVVGDEPSDAEAVDDTESLDMADADASDGADDEWIVDAKASNWGPDSGGTNESWQTSREGGPAYQRVQPRGRRAASTDDDITGPIRPS